MYMVKNMASKNYDMYFTSKQVQKILGLRSTKIEFDNLGHLSSKNGRKILSWLDNEKYLQELECNESISTIFVKKDLVKKVKNVAVILSKNPKYDFCRLHNFLIKNTDFYRNKIPWNYSISKHVIINSDNIAKDKVRIDGGTIIENGVVIYPNVKIGKNVKIGPNVVIGEDGVEFAKKGKKNFRFIHDAGVIIKNNVEISSNTTIKKGLFGEHTIVSENTILGSFVNVGHAAKIGKNCYAAPGTIFSGSCEVGENCYFGINCVILNGVIIGKNCKVGAGSVVTKSIPPNKVVVGVPARILR